MAPRLSTTRAIRAFAFQPNSGSVPLNVYARAPIGCVANRGFHEAATCAVVAFSDGPAYSTRNGPVVVVSLPNQNRLEASFLHICTGRANVVDFVQLWSQRWPKRRPTLREVGEHGQYALGRQDCVQVERDSWHFQRQGKAPT